MDNENFQGMRGTVIRTPGDQAPGLIAAQGRQWPFTLEGVWRSSVAPSPNQTVEFTTDASGAVTRIVVVGAQQLAAEKLRQASNAATEWAQGPGREKLREFGDKSRAAFDSVKAGMQAQREARAASAAQTPSSSPIGGGAAMRDRVIALLEVFLWFYLAVCILAGWGAGSYMADLANATAMYRGGGGGGGFFYHLLGIVCGLVVGVVFTGFGFTLISINAHLAAIRASSSRSGEG
jgi:hypothetical protein